MHKKPSHKIPDIPIQPLEIWETGPQSAFPNEGTSLAIDGNDEERETEFDEIFNGTEDYEDEEYGDGCEGGPINTEVLKEGWRGPIYTADFLTRTAPSIPDARAAKEDLENVLHPWRTSGRGHKDADIDSTLRHRLKLMRSHLVVYTDPIHGKGWTEASKEAIRICDIGCTARINGSYVSRQLRQWSKAYILDRNALPQKNRHGGISIIEDQDLQSDLLTHLQEIGKYVRAQNIVDYMGREDVKQAYDLKKGVSLATAKRWMHYLGYQWSKTPTGQYVDGHEREDVVTYRQQVFIPTWEKLQARMRTWEGEMATLVSLTTGRRVVAWHHDESIFYANDRRKIRWVHNSEKAVPVAKGEGASLMVADFVSADYGWLSSPDGTEQARVLFKPGKNRDGYFDCKEIIDQMTTAMDILTKHFPNEDHVFVFDNATTHTKRADDAISTRKMPKNTPAVGKNWGVNVTERDPNGKIVYDTNGKPKKVIW